MATIIGDLLDEQILKKQQAIQTIQEEIETLQTYKKTYGSDIIISKWEQYTTENGLTRVMITNLDRFPLVGFKYLEQTGVAPTDVYIIPPIFKDYTVFKETYPVFVPISRGV